MAGGIDWFRWHHGSVNDPKFGLVAKKANASIAEVIAVWACILESASESIDRGNPGGLDFEAIDFALGLDDGKAERIHAGMKGRSMIDAESGRVASWDKRQPKREREDNNSTDRSRKHRAMQHQAAPETTVATPCNAMQHQETPRGEESRGEVNQSPIQRREVAQTSDALQPDPETSDALQPEETLPASPVATTKSIRGSRLPADWQLPKQWGEWAMQEKPGWTDGDVRRCSEKFRDHWLSTSGRTAIKADWQATWRNWVRNEKPYHSRASPPASPSYRDQLLGASTAIFGTNSETVNLGRIIDITPNKIVAGCLGG